LIITKADSTAINSDSSIVQQTTIKGDSSVIELLYWCRIRDRRIAKQASRTPRHPGPEPFADPDGQATMSHRPPSAHREHRRPRHDTGSVRRSSREARPKRRMGRTSAADAARSDRRVPRSRRNGEHQNKKAQQLESYWAW